VQAERYSGFADYETKTSRVIPVVRSGARWLTGGHHGHSLLGGSKVA